MAINLVRKPSETPNINNYDDYRMFRYATGGYNGVIEKYGNECDYEINGNTFKIKSGEIVIDGVQSKIDSVGVELTVDNVAGTEYYTVYCEINLSLIDNQKTEIKATKNTVDYPVIEKGDDLTEIQTGIARLELYRFTASNGVISNVTQRFEFIEIGKCKNAVNATKINSLAITKDINGILKIGDYVIPQKKLLWTGNVQASNNNPQYVTLSENLYIGDLVEVEWKIITIEGVTTAKTTALIHEYQSYSDPFPYRNSLSFDFVSSPNADSASILTIEGWLMTDNSMKFYRMRGEDGVKSNYYPYILNIYKIIE